MRVDSNNLYPQSTIYAINMTVGNMTSKIPIVCALVVMLAFASLFTLPKPGASHSIIESKERPEGWWLHCSFDANRNGIDDQLEYLLSTKELDYRTNIFVDYSYHPTEDDVARLKQFDAEIKYVYKYINTTCMRNVKLRDIEKIYSLPGVVMVEIEPEVRKFLDSSVAGMRAKKSNVYNLGVWNDTGITGKGINIAILDSGVDNNHDSLNDMDDNPSTTDPKFIAGVDWTRSLVIIDGSDDPNDVDGHGSHCAGIAMGTGGWSYDYRGVAPGARLVDVKVMKNLGSGSAGDIISGIEWCISNKDKDWEGTGQNVGIQVMSMSLGGRFDDDGSAADAQAVNRAVENGLVVVAATGNDGLRKISNPASADDCIAVGASDDINTIVRSDDVWAYYSNYGPRRSDNDLDRYDELKPDVICPGTNIMSVMANTPAAFVPMTGTSMSTPHVAGVVALMLEANRNLTPAQVKTILHDMAEPHGTPYDTSLSNKYNTTWGYGSVEAYGSVKRAQNLASNRLSAPTSATSGSQVNFESRINLTRTEFSKLNESVRFVIQMPLSWSTPTSITGYSEGSGYTFEYSSPVLSIQGWRFSAWINYTSPATSTVELHPKISFVSTAPEVTNSQNYTITSDVNINSLSCQQAQCRITVSQVQNGIDLYIGSSDISFTPSNPSVNEQVRISALVHNAGSEIATTQVRFYNATPSTPGASVIGQDIIVVPAGSSATANVTWTPESAGTYNIFVSVDPNNQIEETNELNNNATKSISVSSQQLADFGISSSDITFTPSNPSAGQVVSMSATVHNSGGKSASATVEFFNGTPNIDDSNLLGTDSVSVSPGGSDVASISWTPSSEGTYNIFVFVDRQNNVDETNELNNSASKLLVVSAQVSNQQPQAVLTVTPSQGVVGQILTFNGSDSYDPDGSVVRYEFQFGDGSTYGPTTESVVTHSYQNAGVYYANLTVWDNKMNKSEPAQKVVTITADTTRQPLYLDGQSSLIKTKPTNTTDVQKMIQTSTTLWHLGDWGTQKLGANELNGSCEFEFYLVKDSGTASVELNFTLYVGAVGGQVIATAQNEFTGVNSTIKKYNLTAQISDFVLNSGSQIILEIKSRTNSQGISFVYGSNTHPSCVKLPFYSPINILPISVAGADIFAKVNETVYFDATNSTDPDGSIVGYKWNFGDSYCSPSLNTASMPKPSHTYSHEGKYTVVLNVTDNAGGVSTSSLKVTVSVENVPPVIVSYAPQENNLVMNENETLLFNVTVTDANGDSLSYQWYLDKQKLTGKNNREYTYTASYASAGNHTVKVEITDGKDTVSHIWNITVLNVNLPPELVAYEPAYNVVYTNETSPVRFAVNVRDLDENFGLRYLWFLDGNQVFGESANSYIYLEEPDFKSSGTHTVMVMVYDSEDASVSMSWTVYVSNVNRAPECTIEITPKGYVFNEGTTITANAKVSDLDGDKITPAWFLDGVQIGTGFSITIELAEKGMHELKLVVTDANGANATDSKNIRVTPKATQTSPGFDVFILVFAFVLLTSFSIYARKLRRRSF